MSVLNPDPIQRTSSNNEEVHVFSADAYDIMCSNCMKNCNGDNINFIPLRKKLKEFLSSSFEGLSVLINLNVIKYLTKILE